jgi:O-antigen ligase
MSAHLISDSASTRIPLSAEYAKRMANRCGLLFALALFGYPVVGSISPLVGIDNRVLSISFRIAVGLLSVWVMLTSRRLQIDLVRRLILLIWALYIVRLLYDWLVPHLQGADFALQFFLISSVLPAFALMKAQVFQWRRFALVGFLIASAGTLAAIFAALFGNVQSADSLGRLALDTVNPVSLGNQATSAILCGLVLWPAAKARYRLALICVFALLAWCLLLTGSKGPVLQLLVCAVLWSFRLKIIWRFGALLLALPLIVWFTLATESPLATRLADASDDSSTLDRIVIINDSFNQIADSPLIGSAFVELNSGYYPHNVLIEAALAFGVPIALLFAGIILAGIYRALKSIRTEYCLLGLLFFQGLLDAVLAGSLWGMSELWVILALLPAAAAAQRNPSRRLPRDEPVLPAPA